MYTENLKIDKNLIHIVEATSVSIDDLDIFFTKEEKKELRKVGYDKLYYSTISEYINNSNYEIRGKDVSPFAYTEEFEIKTFREFLIVIRLLKKAQAIMQVNNIKCIIF